MNETFYTIPEVAQLLKISLSKAYSWRKKAGLGREIRPQVGDLPHFSRFWWRGWDSNPQPMAYGDIGFKVYATIETIDSRFVGLSIKSASQWILASVLLPFC